MLTAYSHGIESLTRRAAAGKPESRTHRMTLIKAPRSDFLPSLSGFVRVLRENADRRMAFEFAIGVPGLEPQYALLDASRQRTN